ncbi:glycoside hydrolase superfamily [Pseudomassariella vexata]|uniref:Glycoside hydrolase superfamily n=1 Tax=Pseudomassariella vexata TaxID=1141098 RepID=A0A1Y2DH41_9PEZI|nr:glycoside hydrolase superfamily [Pseudomassariella vexata]ORY58446.1 glycoside hydrolase superfamily [Pseudomassariella vexata]
MSSRFRVLNAYGPTILSLLLLLLYQPTEAHVIDRAVSSAPVRERISINADWRFWRSETNPDGLIYDQRSEGSVQVLKPWILPSANDFIANEANQNVRPAGNPGGNVSFVQMSFDDSEWEAVKLPHDWAIKGPFYTGDSPVVGGGMGRLPSHGVGWYRRKLSKNKTDEGRTIYLDIDGAMSYAMVWLNGNLVGGWPYPYNSFRLDITPYLNVGDDNQLAIRLDNPNDSARWYPGGGLYRNIWITKVDSTHVAQYGTFIMTRDVSSSSATVDLSVRVENKGATSRQIEVATDVHVFDPVRGVARAKVAEFERSSVTLAAGEKQVLDGSVTVANPRLWGPAPVQKPYLYVAITRLYTHNQTIDSYQTRFGIRSLTYDANQGLLVNGELIHIQGVNNHHDLGALGAAFNVRAAERQLEIMQEMGVNAIRMSHNPPAPELLDLTDRMGIMVLDEVFDTWQHNKTANDFHLIFDDWHEPDLRAFIRRDRNHASIVSWSYGNEVGEQYDGKAGAAVSQMLLDILHEEDPTRPASISMNYAGPDLPFSAVPDIINLNYRGNGIRDTPAYSNQVGIRTEPQYPAYHAAFPEKLIFSSETASTLSTRGTFIFPVVNATSAPVNETSGSSEADMQVSAYELYSANFGSSPDKVFGTQDASPFVAGEFVWTGFDYIGEPTPYYTARSSYSGIVDLAGLKKDRFFLYQARWRPNLRTAHIVPHWTWPEREGLVTPVHVFSAADEAELFLNGESLGRKERGEAEYRFRWDEVVYVPGELRVVTYKDGEELANATARTAGDATALRITADRTQIQNDGYDLAYITVEVVDGDGNVVPRANNTIRFSVVDGDGEVAATDNGDPADFTVFHSTERKVFSGLALAIIRAVAGGSGTVTVEAASESLEGAIAEPVFQVSPKVPSTFRMLFYDASSNTTPGQLLWIDFLDVTSTMGFGGRKGYGSVWRFKLVGEGAR